MPTQELHPDFQTNPSDTEYFFIGSGKIQAAIQWSRNPECTPLGIILSMPHQFSRKWGSYLFHPELGLERTMVTVIIDRVHYKPKHNDLKVCWSEYEGVPNVLATWHAGEYEVLQSFHAAPDSHALIEWVGIFGAGDKQVEIETALYANPAVFSSFGNKDSVLYDAGYNLIYLSALQPTKITERYINITAKPFDEGGKEVHIVYVTGVREEKVELQTAFEKERKYWAHTSTILSEKYKTITDLYHAAKIGLRAVVSSSGRFDASIWQYGMEWGRDAAMVAEALVYSGQFELAKSVLQNILTKLSNDEGKVAEASRFRGGKDSVVGVVLALTFGYSFSWVFAFLGLLVKTPEAANSVGFIAVFPLTFISSAFVPGQSLPTPLRQFADVNPFTIVVNELRWLWTGQPSPDQLWQAFAWVVFILVLFSPLAVQRYRRAAITG